MPIADLTFLHSAHFPNCAARVDKHFEDYYTLQYMSRGAIELYYDSERYFLRGSWFWSVTPGPRVRFHGLGDPPQWNHRYIAFRGPLVERWREEGLYPLLPQSATQAKGYTALFDEMLTAVDGATTRWNHLRAINLLERILIELAADRAQSPVREPWLENILAVLAADSAFEPDYPALAVDAGMGLSTLRRRFRQAMGVPLHEYVMAHRVTAARKLLGETDLPIKQIAERLGYRDVYFFSRQFRKIAGTSPAAYRKSRQA
jgi:AraC family transcriptional regulator of arabinose operon